MTAKNIAILFGLRAHIVRSRRRIARCTKAWWARRKPTAAWAKRYSKAGKDCFAQVGEALARSREEYEEGERERAAAAKAEVDAREARLKLAAAEAQMEAAKRLAPALRKSEPRPPLLKSRFTYRRCA